MVMKVIKLPFGPFSATRPSNLRDRMLDFMGGVVRIVMFVISPVKRCGKRILRDRQDHRTLSL